MHFIFILFDADKGNNTCIDDRVYDHMVEGIILARQRAPGSTRIVRIGSI